MKVCHPIKYAKIVGKYFTKIIIVQKKTLMRELDFVLIPARFISNLIFINIGKGKSAQSLSILGQQRRCLMRNKYPGIRGWYLGLTPLNINYGRIKQMQKKLGVFLNVRLNKCESFLIASVYIVASKLRALIGLITPKVMLKKTWKPVVEFAII